MEGIGIKKARNPLFIWGFRLLSALGWPSVGARDSAIVSLKLKHLDLDAGSVFQDAREVNTKASKTFTTFFFPVGEEIWVIVELLLFGLDDPLFPKTQVKQGAANVFEPVGVIREHWRTTTPIRKVFKDAFERARLPYFNPRSFRKTLVELAQTTCQGPLEFKAWSQNLGHEGVLTIFLSYGEVQESRQSEIFKTLQAPNSDEKLNRDDEFAKAVAREVVAQMAP